ncbi:MAG: YIP1 family protein [Clostridia bacterium]|nr:YIP1 family protein [Clostridia bacterium]
MKKIAKIAAFMFAFIMLLAPCAMAATPYDTYTYSINGEVLKSPDAYVPDGVAPVNSATIGLDNLGGVAMDNPTDVEADDFGNVYITDSNNNRIVVVDSNYNFKAVIQNFVNGDGVEDTFNTPTSTFTVSEGNYKGLYVCDKLNKRIIKFTINEEVYGEGAYVFEKTFKEPQINFSSDTGAYTPISCVVDKHGRMYVVSDGTTEGIIVLTNEGEFINFIGAPKVSVSALQAIIQTVNPWTTLEFTNVPTTYSNLELDRTYGDFVYGTIMYNADDENSQLTQLTSKVTDYSPVKLLNAGGTDIMQRTGFFAPAGEVAVELNAKVTAANEGAPSGVSKIIDVTSGPDGVWSILDNKRAKIYTYDRLGNLLYIFGDVGEQFGQVTKADNGAGQAITYQIYNQKAMDEKTGAVVDKETTKIIVLDRSNASLIVYRQTEYAQVLATAIGYQNDGEFDKATGAWEDVLARNNNFDTAYVEMGKAIYRNAKDRDDLDTALAYFENAYDTENYATVFKAIRADIMERYFIFLVIGIIVLLFVVVKVFGYAGKVNKAAATKGGKRSLKEELTYGFHIIFHPFDGYWDLKKEKRGSMRAAIIFLIITVVAFYYQGIGQGYYYKPQGSTATVISQAATVLIPFFLWVISNWCFTTLFDGEGSFKDIFIATAYALFPLPILVIVSTLLTQVLVGTESQIPTLIISVAYIWMAFLIIIGMQVTHDYSMGKNIVTVVATIAGMVIIMFIVVLFITLISKMTSFVSTITSELSYR